METDSERKRGSLERIKIHKIFAVFSFDKLSSRASQIDRLSSFMASLHSIAISKGIDNGWDILPDFDENIIDDERVTSYALVASGWRWETDKEYKDRLETNLFYKRKAYDAWKEKFVHFSTLDDFPSPHEVQVQELEKKIAEIGK